MPQVKVEDLVSAYKVEHLDLLNKLTLAKAQLAGLQETVNRQALQIEELQQRVPQDEDDSSAVTIIG